MLFLAVSLYSYGMSEILSCACGEWMQDHPLVGLSRMDASGRTVESRKC